jgi:hypothetical protein
MDSLNVFISHNKADKRAARSLAVELTLHGAGAWFDEWEIQLGDSIAGGIEKGLSSANVFVLIWSANAVKSNWVGTELNAYLHRRINDATLRIIPVMLDDTPLPALVADYRGVKFEGEGSFAEIAQQVTGAQTDNELVRQLQNRFLEITDSGGYNFNDSLPYVVCPKCGCKELKRSTQYNEYGTYYCIQCQDCPWNDGGEV